MALFSRLEAWLFRRLVRDALDRASTPLSLAYMNAIVYQEVRRRCHEENVPSWLCHMRDAVKYGAIRGAETEHEVTVICKYAEQQGF